MGRESPGFIPLCASGCFASMLLVSFDQKLEDCLARIGLDLHRRHTLRLTQERIVLFVALVDRPVQPVTFYSNDSLLVSLEAVVLENYQT